MRSKYRALLWEQLRIAGVVNASVGAAALLVLAMLQMFAHLNIIHVIDLPEVFLWVIMGASGMELSLVVLRGGGKDSFFFGFDQRLTRLPLGTFPLVAIPMIVRVGSVGVIGLSLWGISVVTLQKLLPLQWLLLLIEFSAMFQTLIWTRNSIRGLWLIAGVFGLTAASVVRFVLYPEIGLLDLVVNAARFASHPICAALLLFVLLGLALVGVYWDRRDECHGLPALREAKEHLASVGKTRNKPFKSPLDALLWFESRTLGWSLPLIMAVALALLSLMRLSLHDRNLGAFDDPFFYSYAALFIAVFIVGAGNTVRSWGRLRGLAPFNIARPVLPSDAAWARILHSARAVSLCAVVALSISSAAAFLHIGPRAQIMHEVLLRTEATWLDFLAFLMGPFLAALIVCWFVLWLPTITYVLVLLAAFVSIQWGYVTAWSGSDPSMRPVYLGNASAALCAPLFLLAMLVVCAKHKLITCFQLAVLFVVLFAFACILSLATGAGVLSPGAGALSLMVMSVLFLPIPATLLMFRSRLGEISGVSKTTIFRNCVQPWSIGVVALLVGCTFIMRWVIYWNPCLIKEYRKAGLWSEQRQYGFEPYCPREDMPKTHSLVALAEPLGLRAEDSKGKWPADLQNVSAPEDNFKRCGSPEQPEVNADARTEFLRRHAPEMGNLHRAFGADQECPVGDELSRSQDGYADGEAFKLLERVLSLELLECLKHDDDAGAIRNLQSYFELLKLNPWYPGRQHLAFRIAWVLNAKRLNSAALKELSVIACQAPPGYTPKPVDELWALRGHAKMAPNEEHWQQDIAHWPDEFLRYAPSPSYWPVIVFENLTGNQLLRALHRFCLVQELLALRRRSLPEAIREFRRLEASKDTYEPNVQAELQHLGDLLEHEATALSWSRLQCAALAIEQYQRANGTIPECLGQLLPHYLTALPEDPFCGRPIGFRPLENGYFLYSTGPDGKDSPTLSSSNLHDDLVFCVVRPDLESGPRPGVDDP